jgi:hypothetical protein
VQLVVDTGLSDVPAGEASFELFNYVGDAGGDLTAAVIAPAKPVAAGYDAVKVAPAIGNGGQVAGAPSCTYDPASQTSTTTQQVVLDNTGSTLPVEFSVGGVTRVVAAWTMSTISVPTAVGTTSLDVYAGGKLVGSVPVNVTDCAPPAWPDSVEVSATSQCIAGGPPGQAAQVMVVVTNAGSHDYTVRADISGIAWTAPVSLGAQDSVTLTIPLGSDGLITKGGTVVVELSGDAVGNNAVMTTSVSYDAVTCHSQTGSARQWRVHHKMTQRRA